MLNCPKTLVLVFIAAHNAGKTITSADRRIPRNLSTPYGMDLLVMDDAPSDALCPIRAFYNPVDQEYGGNREPGYRPAIRDNCREDRRPS
jgi:hypothetical protein